MLEDFVWIQTRDSSPTLWNNALGEPFRSFKGAFTESWAVFVEPCLKSISEAGRKKVCFGEFGLGPGTNWLLISAALKSLGVELEYFAIERDKRSFEMGLDKWRECLDQVSNFLTERGLEPGDLSDLLSEKFQPVIFESIEEARGSKLRADFWFHDPFGFAVNPDGYSLDVLSQCKSLWNEKVFGVSYACNKHFQLALEDLGSCDVRVVDLGDRRLKRSRLEFSS
ncbi:hypothetical protein GW915_02745 [bacterium]|nr:hypothetical protein [bacterium]